MNYILLITYCKVHDLTTVVQGCYSCFPTLAALVFPHLSHGPGRLPGAYFQTLQLLMFLTLCVSFFSTLKYF